MLKYARVKSKQQLLCIIYIYTPYNIVIGPLLGVQLILLDQFNDLPLFCRIVTSLKVFIWIVEWVDFLSNLVLPWQTTATNTLLVEIYL